MLPHRFIYYDISFSRLFGEYNMLKLLAKPYKAVINFKHPLSEGYHSNREKLEFGCRNNEV